MTLIDVRRLVPDDWLIERELRLAALRDAPFAFGSTLAEALAFDEPRWRARLRGQTRIASFLDGRPAGTAGWSPAWAPYPAGEVILVGMWVAPGARGRGVGDALVTAVLSDAARTGATTIRLAVTPGNEPAIRLYGRHGFVAVDEPDRIEPDMVEMTRHFPLR